MYGGLGLPPFGLPGVALATVVIQCLGNAYLFTRLIRSGVIETFRLRELLPRRHYYLELARDLLQNIMRIPGISADRLDISLELAKIYFSLDAFSDAQKNLTTILQFEPDNVDAYTLMVETAFSTQNWSYLIQLSRRRVPNIPPEMHAALDWWSEISLSK